MSTTTATRSPATLRELLQNGAPTNEPPEAIRHAADLPQVHVAVEHGLGHLSRAASRAVDAEISSVVDRLLEVDLAQTLISGWRKYSALREAAQRSLAEPRTPVVVDLVTHRVHLDHEPRIALVVDDVTVAELDLLITVVFDITALAATVREGRLVALSGGKCTVSGSLAIETVEVAKRSADWDPQLMFDLENEIPLLGGDTATARTRADMVAAPTRGAKPTPPVGSGRRYTEPLGGGTSR